MRFVPDAVGRKLGMVGSTVLACRATLKLEGVLDEIEADKEKAKEVYELVEEEGGTTKSGQTYSHSEYRRDVAIITTRGIGRIAKLYAPSLVLGSASIFALTKSHSILQDRNLALTAAYAAVDGAFTRYRGRVVDRFGQEVDDELRYDSEQIDEADEETGEVTSRTVVTDAPGSAYVQTYANDLLRMRGHVFLNEVFSELGLSHTRAGAVVGWRWNKDSGDDYIDFGIWKGRGEEVKDFFNGREDAILLDFNVDGVIADKIDEGVI
jgi:hypothetical protein